MKKREIINSILIITILIIICLNFVNAFATCTDSHSGEGYYQAGAVVGWNSTLNNFCDSSNNYCDNHFSIRASRLDYWASLDYCEGDYVLEAYCKGNASEHLVTGGTLSYDKYLCELGCEENSFGEGYCLSAPKVCANLNKTVKDKIIELQNAGKKVFLIEGTGFVTEEEYVVISQEDYSRILEVEEIRYNLTSKWIYLKDIVNNESLNFIFNKSQEETNLSLIIDGKKYYIYPDFMLYRDTTFGSFIITWGEGASNELLERGIGTETTVSCPNECKNGLCLDCLEDWDCTNWGKNCTNHLKTRRCTDKNKCGTTNDKPSEHQRCSCTVNWICGNWTKCTNKITKKNCTDLNECETTFNKPITSRICNREELDDGEIIEAVINNKKIVFERNFSENGVLMVNNMSVKSFLNITGENGKLYAMTSFGSEEIKILPEEAILKSEQINTVNNIILNEYNGKIVYSISGIKKAKLFAFIPLSVEIEQKVDATSGEILFTKKPWWIFLTGEFEPPLKIITKVPNSS